MADVHNQQTRSYNMSRIRSKNTKPELLVRRFLHGNGFRYRLHVKTLPGKPDIVLPKYKTVIFVHGCFWHGHEGCKYYVVPQTRTEWWLNKIGTNINSDTNAESLLKGAEWLVIIIWDCSLKSTTIHETFKNLLSQLNKNATRTSLY
jgi:DNA mismatch endonuclease, patch repair protein